METTEITLPDGIGPDENVTFVFLQCRTCGEKGPTVRADDHGYPDGPWDYNHGRTTGHKAFYLFTLSRQTARLF
ncbi:MULTISPECIES: hypothetical protein [Nocardia]|uniref:hypothetical protein n=1 Tax=Nocardia TaxID=1817 RepID=UPI0024538B42|nr:MULTISPECIES: hypothetical protein [Nocardia]